MAGIYIHIPFCKQKCGYCDFYSVVSEKHKSLYINALQKELHLRKDYLENAPIETIYFGGGTPSVLNINELDSIFDTIYQLFSINKDVEITFEANPDDLNIEYLKSLKSTPINRLSIGIQSFRDEDLKFMNRRHSSQQAIEAVKNAQLLGFKNNTIDLIYGLPNLSLEGWKQNLQTAFSLDIRHISAYHLTFEPQTIFGKQVKKGLIQPIDEEKSVEQFELLINETRKNGFIQYEISNFGKENHFSQHNSNYWKQKSYLGIGASAHSYNLISRQWNVATITKYIDSITMNLIDAEIEQLSPNDRYNDYLITSLRTIWGCDLNYIEKEFGQTIREKFVRLAQHFMNSNHLILLDNVLILSDKGKFISDAIMERLIL